MLNSFTAPIEQDCFGARIVFGNSSVIKLAVHHVSRKSRKFVQSPLFARTLGNAVVINSVVGVMAVSDVCSIAWLDDCQCGEENDGVVCIPCISSIYRSKYDGQAVGNSDTAYSNSPF